MPRDDSTSLDVLATLAEPVQLADPYPFYRDLQCRPPVRMPTGEWVFTRYGDVTSVLRDSRFAKPTLPRPPLKPARVLFRMFLLLNPPEHTRLRRTVASAFSSAAVARLRPTIEGAVTGALPSKAGTIDLMRDFANPLPLTVIGELLDIPSCDQARVGAWSRTLTESLDTPVPTRLRDAPTFVRNVLKGESHPIAAVRAASSMVRFARDRLSANTERADGSLMHLLARSQADGHLEPTKPPRCGS